ncbi:MAG: FkbM family methyltransferase [Pseudomonadota bacterium]
MNEIALAQLLPLPAYCRWVNVTRALRGIGYRLRPFGEGDIHVVTDPGGAEVHLCRRARHRRYKRGIAGGAASLAGRYGLRGLPFSPGGVLVDCGANVGELGIWAKAQGLDYIAYEPEQLEARTCDLNNFDGRPETRRRALWRDDTTLTFYRKPNTADSSVIEIDATHGTVEIEAVRLASDLSLPETGTHIFKLEAEGAEPEVLEGAAPILEQFSYVAVDAGRERGRAQETTIVEVIDRLTSLNFQLLGLNADHLTVTFRNRTC